jgi:hypothetical protein
MFIAAGLITSPGKHPPFIGQIPAGLSQNFRHKAVFFLTVEAFPKLKFWESNLEICSFARLKA